MNEINFNIEDIEKIDLSMDVGIKEIYPPLENLEITPTKEQQIFNHENSYGYNEVIVNPINSQDKELTINENGTHIIRADEEYDALNQVSVTVDAIEDLTNELDTYNTELTEQETSLEDIIEALKDKGVGEVPKYKPYHILFRNFKGKDLTYETSNLDTSNITNMQDMFNYSSSLTTVDVSEWNTSNVTIMNSIFYYCSKLNNIDVSEWNTSNATEMSSVFQNCSALTQLDVSKWNVGKVKRMDSMFKSCTNLTELDLSGWVTTSLTNSSNMFYMCKNLQSIDIRNFDFSQITTYTDMFGTSSTTSFNHNCLIIVKDDDAKTWVTSKFTYLTNVKTVAELEV